MKASKKIGTESRAQRFDDEYPFFKDMRTAFRKTAQSILDGKVVVSGKGPNMRQAGIELERSCIHLNGQPISEEVRDALVSQHNKSLVPDQHEPWQQELGRSQIELGTRPIAIKKPLGLTALRDAMRLEDDLLVRTLANCNAIPVRLGCQPILPLDDSCRTTSNPRYRVVPDFHTKHRRQGMAPFVGLHTGQVRADQAGTVGITSSVQLNLDCANAAEALRMLNVSFEIGPLALAMSGNSRYVDGLDTGYADVRCALWEATHDIRTHDELAQGLSGRTGLPTGYFNSLAEYFRDLHDQPSILDDKARAFEIATGLYWRDSRLKFLYLETDNPQIVLEFRPVSVQPTVDEEYALMAFAIGALEARMALPESLLPFPFLHDNRTSAMMDGTRGMFWIMWEGKAQRVSTSDALATEFLLARLGLKELGASPSEINEVTAFWERSLRVGCPSDRLADRFRDKPVNRDILQHFLCTPNRSNL